MKTAECLAPHPQLEAFYEQLRGDMSKRYKIYDALDNELLLNLVQTYIAGEAHMSTHIQEKGLTLAGLNVMCILLQHKPRGCPLNALSDLLLVSRANITGVVDSLVRKGFVTREEYATDRRITLAKITRAGETWVDHYLPRHYAKLQGLLAGITVPEKKTLIHILSKLRHSTCQHPRGGTL